MKKGWQGLLHWWTLKPTRLQKQPPSGRVSFQPQTPSVLWPSFRRTNESWAGFQVSLPEEKPSPTLSRVRTQAHNADKMPTLPDPSYGLRVSGSLQDKITIKQAKLKLRSTPSTGSSWWMKEKWSFKTYWGVGIHKKVGELLSHLSFLAGRPLKESDCKGWGFVQNEMTLHTRYLDQNWTDSSNFEWVLCPCTPMVFPP